MASETQSTVIPQELTRLGGGTAGGKRVRWGRAQEGGRRDRRHLDIRIMSEIRVNAPAGRHRSDRRQGQFRRALSHGTQ